mgnify:CR=1 FL=1
MLVVGSGNVVHNIRRVDFSQPDAGFDWARRFDEAARELMTEGDPTSLFTLGAHPDFRAAVPTPDHFLPLAYLAGLAGAANDRADVLVDGYAAGSLSMTAYTLDATCPDIDPSAGPAAELPADVPADGTNL